MKAYLMILSFAATLFGNQALAQDQKIETLSDYDALVRELNSSASKYSKTYANVKCGWLQGMAAIVLMWEMQGVSKEAARDTLFTQLGPNENRDVVRFMNTTLNMSYALPEKGPNYLKSGTFMELCVPLYQR